MSFTVESFPREKYLLIILKGEIVKDSEAEQMQNLIFESIHNNSNRFNKVIVDARQVGHRSTITSTFFRATQVPKEIKILQLAYVDRDTPESTARVSETMYRNAGSFIKLFDSIETAEDWLIK